MEQQTTRQRRIDLAARHSDRVAALATAAGTERDRRKVQEETTRFVLESTTPPALRRLARMIIGHPGAIATAGLSLLAVTTITGSRPANMVEMLIGAVTLRVLAILIQTSSLSHEQGLLRLSAGQMWRDETVFALVFCTAAFLLNWQITAAITTIYLILNFSTQVGIHLVGRVILRRTAAKKLTTGDSRAIVIGTGARARQVVDALLDHPELDIQPGGFLDDERTGLWRYRDVPLLGHPDDFEQLVLREQVDALFVTTEPHEATVSPKLLDLARKMGVTVHLVPGYGSFPAAALEIARLNGFPTLVYRATPYRYTMMVLKRAADIVGAIVLILLASPVMLTAALAIKAGSRGPMLFNQVRSGRNGRRFMLYKFRTMTCDAEKKKASLWHCNEMSGPVFKIKNDPRVTRIGKYLRKYSVDELPQLFNVLAGDMSLVGPRPPLPSEVLGYEPWQRRKLSVRPGLTCLWQVNGRNAIDFSDWMRLDLEYIDTWSLALDMKILARTIPTVLKGSGV